VELLQQIGTGFAVALQPTNLFYCFVGVFIGTLIGVLPGIGPVGAMSLLFPVTFKATPEAAIIMLAGIYYGAMYGGSTTSILVNIPGEAASVVTCLDGYQMARKGRAGPALGMSAFGSFLGGTASIVGLMALVPYVSAVLATNLFGAVAPEFFGDLGASLFTLFQVLTVEGWPDIARSVMAQSPYAWMFFVAYLLIATFMVLNLFIAVVVNAMQSQVTEDLKGDGEAHTRLSLDEVRALRQELEALRKASLP